MEVPDGAARMLLVGRLQAQVERGDYRIDSTLVADAIIEFYSRG